MTYERDTGCSNQMEDNSQHWTPPEGGLFLGRNASEQNKKLCM
jgi:hypothetical protein